MNQYANSVRIAFRNNQTEAIIKFYQESPVISPAGEITEQEIAEVASIVMHPEVVKQLRDMLISSLREVLPEDNNTETPL